MKIKALIFSGGVSPSSLSVMLTTWSRFSHVVVELDDGRILDANLLDGVSIRKPDQNKYGWQKRVPFDGICTAGQLTEALSLLKSQLGQPYDTDWLFDYLFKKKGRWQDQDKWVCSELVWFAFPCLRNKQQHRVTPKNVWHAVKRLHNSIE